MNEFVIPEIVALSGGLAARHYPLDRARVLQNSFSQLLSRHLGGLQSGARFETGALLVTGPSGAGKSKEIGDLLGRFNASDTRLPSGEKASFARCVLSSKGGWKDLGKHTLRALGYPIHDKARRTQTEIWNLVVDQAKRKGCIGIHYDEAQHIMRGRGEGELLAILDAFKALMKSHDWPLMLILSGVPELADYVRQEPQLFRLTTRVRFEDIDLTEREDGSLGDYLTLNTILGSYGDKESIEVPDELRDIEFLHRLATAAAFRWGLVFEIVLAALQVAIDRGARELTRQDFDKAWANKTGTAEIASPFSSPNYRSIYRRDRPFEEAYLD